MARRTIPVNQSALQSIITSLESETSFDTQNDLWQKAADSYNSSLPHGDCVDEITFSVVGLRAKQWNLEFSTKSARGRRKGQGMSDEHKAKLAAGRASGDGISSKKKRIKTDPLYLESIAAVKDEFDGVSGLSTTISGYCKGSLTAAIRLNCLSCCGGSRQDVKSCSSTGCAFWIHRPWQYDVDSDSDSDDIDVDESAAA